MGSNSFYLFALLRNVGVGAAVAYDSCLRAFLLNFPGGTLLFRFGCPFVLIMII